MTRRREEGGRSGCVLFLIALAVLGAVAAFWATSYLGEMRRRAERDKKWKAAQGAIRSLPGKTPDEVIKAIGRPDSTRGDAWKEDEAEWTYFNAVWNRATDRFDTSLSVRFVKGKVESP